MPIENKGLSATAHVARVNMDQQQIVENIETFMEAVRQRLGFYSSFILDAVHLVFRAGALYS